jgi:hypothetical protein
MTLENIVFLSEILASIAVVITLIYLAKQVKQSTRVNRAASRHSLSEFALELTKFRAEHSDRWVKVMQEKNLTSGDIEFRNWNHMMLLLHAETYYHHYKLKLMPENHWKNYAKFIMVALDSPGFEDYWNEVGFAFSEDFSEWINKIFSESKVEK